MSGKSFHVSYLFQKSILSLTIYVYLHVCYQKIYELLVLSMANVVIFSSYKSKIVMDFFFITHLSPDVISYKGNFSNKLIFSFALHLISRDFKISEQLMPIERRSRATLPSSFRNPEPFFKNLLFQAHSLQPPFRLYKFRRPPAHQIWREFKMRTQC